MPAGIAVCKKRRQRGYGTSSEYVRELIRKDQDRLQPRRLLLAGAASARQFQRRLIRLAAVERRQRFAEQRLPAGRPPDSRLWSTIVYANETRKPHMDYVTVRELREKSGEIWQRVEAGEEFVITRNGKPFALLVHTEPAAVEDRLRALRLSRLSELAQAIRDDAQASGASLLTDEDIQAEIDGARRR